MPCTHVAWNGICVSGIHTLGHACLQACAAGALRNLAANDQLHGLLLDAGCIPGLAAVLAAHDREACEPALDALRNLASGRHDVKAALVAQGAAPALVAAARGLPGDLRAAALSGEAQADAGACAV